MFTVPMAVTSKDVENLKKLVPKFEELGYGRYAYNDLQNRKYLVTNFLNNYGNLSDSNEYNIFYRTLFDLDELGEECILAIAAMTDQQFSLGQLYRVSSDFGEESGNTIIITEVEGKKYSYCAMDKTVKSFFTERSAFAKQLTKLTLEEIIEVFKPKQMKENCIVLEFANEQLREFAIKLCDKYTKKTDAESIKSYYERYPNYSVYFDGSDGGFASKKNDVDRRKLHVFSFSDLDKLDDILKEGFERYKTIEVAGFKADFSNKGEVKFGCQIFRSDELIALMSVKGIVKRLREHKAKLEITSEGIFVNGNSVNIEEISSKIN